MIIDGRALAVVVLARTKARAERLPRRPQVAAYAINPTPATRSYLKIKERSAEVADCGFEVLGINDTVRSDNIVDSIQTSRADAVIVQLPLPEGMDTKVICDAIPIEKDADVLSSAARTCFESMGFVNPYILPPVVGAIKEIFDTYHIDVRGKHAVVIGKGFLVGAPAASWLRAQGADIVVADSKTHTLPDLLHTADIVISGIGVPHFIKPEMVKDGAVLIDAGTSESSGKVVGDADPACAAKCAFFTPVPGGVGPLAVAKLFENTVTLTENATK